MEDLGNVTFAGPPQAPIPRRRGNRWLWLGGLALAFALAVGIGAFFGSQISAAYAANTANTSGGQYSGFGPARFSNSNATPASGSATRAQCDALTVSSVSSQTITAKASDGSTVTIHTTASTTYTRSGQSASASAVTAGERIHVTGTHNSDGSITATSIDIG
ncbi:MAG TPA: DUF5666 domain-containing protein [Ktedonobacterales bacterium]|nr:DUF5666 domain-containing protein [Ktedonobacterales bacterium]